MKAKLKRKKSIQIIGYGRVGSHLDFSLRESPRFSIVKGGGDIIFISTPDSRVKDVVEKLARFSVKDRIIFHTSGVLTSEVLKPLQDEGADTGSFHPVQTFAKKATKQGDTGWLKGMYVMIEGSKRAVGVGASIAREMGAKPKVIEKGDKILHHICCVIGSNYVTCLMGIVEELGKKIRINGFNKRSFLSIYAPLVKQTLKNLEKYGPAESLTGPIERGDTETIRMHVMELGKKAPEFSKIYKALGRETANLANRKGSLGSVEFEGLVKLLGYET